MYTRLRTCLVYVLVMLCAFCQAQQDPRTPQDFENMLKGNLPDTTRIDVNVKLAELYRYSEPARAMKHCQTAVALAEKIDNPRSLAYAYFTLAVQYRREDAYSQSIKYYYKALRLYKQMKNFKNVARVHGSAALVYWSQEKYDDALREFNLSLTVARQMADSMTIYSNLNNIGGVYLYQKKYDSALTYFNYCYGYYLRTHDTLGLAELSGNIGDVLLKKNKDDEALKYYLDAERYARYSQHKYVTMTSFGNMAILYGRRKDFLKAIELNRQGIRISLELGAPANRRDMYEAMAQFYAAAGQYKKAYEYYGFYSDLKDSLASEQNNRQINELRLKYDLDSKDQQLKVNRAQLTKKDEEAKRRDAERNMLVIAVVLVLLVALAVFVVYRLNNRAKKEQERKNLIIEAKNKEIVDSINYAKRIQYALLAHDDLLKKNLPEHFVLFKPKDIVSGDFYWATRASAVRSSMFNVQNQINTEHQTENTEHFYLAVCDSTGHGVPGAFMSLLNISFLNEAINEKGIEKPNEVFNHVRQRLIENISHDGAQDGMDATLVKFEIQDSGFKIEYAAAYNAPLVIRNGELISFPCDKMPIGKSESTEPFKLYTMSLEKGDMLYLYTDGYADQFGGPQGKKLKEANLRKLFTHIHKLPAGEQKARLTAEFITWAGKLEQVDDVCVIGIRI